MDISLYPLGLLVCTAILFVWLMVPLAIALFQFCCRFVDDDSRPIKLISPLTFKAKRNAVDHWGHLFFVGMIASILWPLTLVVLSVAAVLYCLRFMFRCGKSISRLAQVAHDHSGPDGSPNPKYVTKPKFTGDYE